MSTSDVRWPLTTSTTLENLNRDLNLILTLYAISMALGFQVLAESFYRLCFPQSATAPRGTAIVLLTVLAFVLTAIGIRFFWAVNNIRRLILHRTAQLHSVGRRALVLFHFPVLFLHSLLFFILCRLQFNMHNSFDHFNPFIGLYSLLLTLNAAWMLILTKGRLDTRPESFWMWNNFTFGFLGFLLMLIARVLSQAGAPVLWGASALFFVNSAIDLSFMPRAYIMGE
ncbi:MAG TPA: hypothetical protein VJN89_17520 [Candidatus Acidoferrum sp.]|nr:hypothetical protein [Candidatus Acidoferrum sp.]